MIAIGKAHLLFNIPENVHERHFAFTFRYVYYSEMQYRMKSRVPKYLRKQR